MKKALDGVNVLEFSGHHGTAYTAMLLAEQGADALKVEPPGGDPARGTPHFHALNRSKRSLCLDLESPEEHRRIPPLVRWADIVVTGSTPKRLAAHELDYASLSRLNPRVIVLTMPPMGSRGPDAEFQANDDLVAARGGITGTQWARSGDPVALTFPASTYSAGVMGATAAVAALLDRGDDGRGQEVEVSLLAGAFSLQTGGIIRSEKMDRLYGGPMDPLGPIPCYRLFEAGDGRYLFVACGNAVFWGKFALALGRPELVSDPRFENAPWGVPRENWQVLKDILEPIIRTRPRDEWLSVLREYDVPCAPVMTRRDFIDDEQVRALGMRREIVDPALGSTVQMGVPLVLSETPGEIRGPTPAAGHRGEAMVDTPSAIADPIPVKSRRDRSSSGPLEGVTILDFTSYIAGSYGPMILSQMGAEVIKIESFSGDAFRSFGFGFLGWNQGKRALAIDLASTQGREIIHGLVRKADIVVENLRPGRMRKFGLDYETLAAQNPRLIFMSVNGFGNHGPQHNQPGFDPLLQARSGVMAAQGGHNGHPVYLTCALCDYGAAMLSALGCVLALKAREATGRGQFCETSLLQAAMAFQAGEFVFYHGRPDMENGGTESRGLSALSRAYRAADEKWLFLSIGKPHEWSALREAMPLLPALPYEDTVAQPRDGELAEALSEALSKFTREEALKLLAKAGVPATYVHSFGDLFSDEQVKANQLTVELVHPEWGRLEQTGILAKFSRTPGRVSSPAPLLGEHTDAILHDYLGYDGARIASLRAGKIVK